MSLQPAQVYSYLTTAARNIGFNKLVINDDNVSDIGVTSPNDINSLYSSLNLILNNEFITNIGKYSEFAKRYKTYSKNNGAGTKVTKFSAPDLTKAPYQGKGGEFNDKTYKAYIDNSFENLVTQSQITKVKQTNYISTINGRFNPFVTLNKREIAKLYTKQGAVEYANNLIDYLSKSFDYYMSYKLIDMFINNYDKMVNKYYGSSLNITYPIDDVISLCSPSSIDFISNDTATKPDNIDKNIISKETDFIAYLFIGIPSQYYTQFHIKPQLEYIFTRRNTSTNIVKNGIQPAGFLINKNAINFKIYNNSVSEFNIPNSPFEVNVYFNADYELSIDCSYPMVAYISGTKPASANLLSENNEINNKEEI